MLKRIYKNEWLRSKWQLKESHVCINGIAILMMCAAGEMAHYVSNVLGLVRTENNPNEGFYSIRRNGEVFYLRLLFFVYLSGRDCRIDIVKYVYCRLIRAFDTINGRSPAIFNDSITNFCVRFIVFLFRGASTVSVFRSNIPALSHKRAPENNIRC